MGSISQCRLAKKIKNKGNTKFKEEIFPECMEQQL